MINVRLCRFFVQVSPRRRAALFWFGGRGLCCCTR